MPEDFNSSVLHLRYPPPDKQVITIKITWFYSNAVVNEQVTYSLSTEYKQLSNYQELTFSETGSWVKNSKKSKENKLFACKNWKEYIQKY